MDAVGVMKSRVSFYSAEDELCLIEQHRSASHQLPCTKMKTCDITLVLWEF